MNFKSVLKWLKRKENKEQAVIKTVDDLIETFLTGKQINTLHNENVRANKKRKKNRAKNKVARESRRGNKK